MLFQANATVRTIRHALAAAIAISVVSATAQAQITLRPAPERIVERPVSRDLEPVVREPLQFGSNSLAVNSLTVSARAAEFQQLQQEADVLDRQLSLIRRISKFASPSIVHIEASKKSDPGKGFASSRVEEAGAGVIVDLNGGQYILTNRHVIYPAETSSILVETNDGGL